MGHTYLVKSIRGKGEKDMTMKIKERQIAGVAIVDISGRITLGDGTALLRDTIRDLIARGNKNILLNLGEVAYIDSSGVGELVSAFLGTRREGGDVKLLNLTKRVRDVVEIVKLGSIFEIFDNEAAAVEAFTRLGSPARDLRAQTG
jgi:anti-sigma B factor antagonist